MLAYLPQYKTTTLSVTGGIDATQTTGIVLADVTGIDITKPGIICVGYAVPLVIDDIEFIAYTSINGSNELVGVTRGYEGITAKVFDNQAVIGYSISKSHINNIIDALLEEHAEDGTHDATKVVKMTGDQTVAGVKTFTSPVINTGISGTAIVDEDTMSSDSAVKLPTQQSVKAYVDAKKTLTSSDDHIVLTPGTSKLVKISVLRQDDTTNSYKNNSVILTGYGVINGTGSANPYKAETVTFGITFAAAPIVICSGAGRGSVGAGSLNSPWSDYFVATPGSISTTNFVANVFRSPGVTNLDSFDYVYTWIAIGVL